LFRDASPQHTVQLAIETTGRLGSIAVLFGSQVLRQANLDPSSRTAATLAPAIDETLRWCRERDQQPEFISVADGPGSFTGLRIGVTTAKTLSYALDLPLIAVDSLAAIAAAAFQNNPSVESLLVAIDAYRGQVFTGSFQRIELLPPLDSIPDDWTAHPSSVRIVSAPQWVQVLRNRPPNIDVAGDSKPLDDRENARIRRECDAVGVGLLAIRAAIKGTLTDPISLVPRYLKPSAAEEKSAEKAAEDIFRHR
jgi:tRNA threonylcarbamoyl adenosine modification protein YeaZ